MMDNYNEYENYGGYNADTETAPVGDVGGTFQGISQPMAAMRCFSSSKFWAASAPEDSLLL